MSLFQKQKRVVLMRKVKSVMFLKLFQPNNLADLLGCKDLPKEFDVVDTPDEYFNYFFHEKILEDLVFKSKLFSASKTH